MHTSLSKIAKKLKWPQSELAKKVGAIAVTIGRYERNEIKPSIDIATKIADVLDVSLDYLVGNSDIEVNADMLNRVLELQTLSDDDKNTALKLLDAFLRDSKAKQAYTK